MKKKSAKIRFTYTETKHSFTYTERLDANPGGRFAEREDA